MLVLGLDGACWTLIDRFVSEGRMPHVEGLLQRGVRAPLQSTNPPMTLPSWSSMLTGTNPGKHGIFDFVHRMGEGWELAFSNSTHRGVPTIHRVLSDRGARVASLCVPTTWPPESLNGVMVSGFDSPVSTGIDESHCSPKGVYQELRSRFDGLRFADFNECRIDDDWHQKARAALLKEIPRKEAVSRWLLQQERWDLMMLLWGETDTVSHHFWAHSDPNSPRHNAVRAQANRNAIRDVYETVDRSIGRLLDAASPELVVLCSDHGFGGAGAHCLYLNQYLRNTGWLRFVDNRVGLGQQWMGRARNWAAQYLPHQMQGSVFRRLPAPLLDRMESNARLGRVYIPASRAFSDEMNYAATLRLNLPASQHRSVLKELEQCLLDWTVDGHQVVKKVHYRSDLYWGDWVHRSPEVILELNLRDGYSYTLLPSQGVSDSSMDTWRKLEGEALQGAKGMGMAGSHRSEGILLIAGDGVEHGRIEQASMWDIAPTILAEMGEDIPAYMDGKGLLQTDSRRTPVVSTLSDAPQTMSWARQRALRQRLQRLGYL